MTTITREHLELAALAAGHRIEPGLPPQVLARTYREGGQTVELYREWRPHTDPGDTARLAARLEIEIQPLRLRVIARSSDGDWDMQRHDGTEPDKLRAWCEAVTLCAAEIGLRMKENER